MTDNIYPPPFTDSPKLRAEQAKRTLQSLCEKCHQPLGDESIRVTGFPGVYHWACAPLNSD